MHDGQLKAIIASYDSFVIRSYCRIRFTILRQRFLEEIGQYLPESGEVLDIGCGFGLFALYFAMTHPEIQVHGVDLNSKRVATAQKAAERLGLKNVRFEVKDARSIRFSGEHAGAYMLDLVHHIPPEKVGPLLEHLSQVVVPGGRIIVKDVDTKPYYKRSVTWLLDKVMDFRAPVRYWSQAEFMDLARSLGLQVYRHAMIDILPYPHVIYVCRVKEGPHAQKEIRSSSEAGTSASP